MNIHIINQLKTIEKHHKEIELLLNKPTPDAIVNIAISRNLSKEYTELNNIANLFKSWVKANKETIWLEKLLADKDIWHLAKEEVILLKTNINEIEQRLLKSKAVPKDEHDKYGCYIEIKTGTGGNESTLFVNALYRMYYKYAESKRWSVSLLSKSTNNYGGCTEVIFKVSNSGSYGLLKFESGGHRVQRIPNTESQGRIHTSTCIVAVLVEDNNNAIANLNESELRIDTFRSSGAGGQHVNKTESAVRITHLPTGLSVECQDERSQYKNKTKALAILNTRLNNFELKRKHKEESLIKKTLLGTGYRCDRIRTYNYQQCRITDHRIDLTIYKLTEVLNGDLDLLIQPILNKYYYDESI
ncbi:peptide chain release factor 1 [Candidatus Tremblaya phenacola]|uniref:peptide chain release factor 1 n=1 Tax=Candidatus Tremblayella phenacoccinincola TaxID=1010676 RepID=UPI001980018E|nr:peptide chain release factor 1 [Candidatus Tremblaya phenacola]KAH0998181.1 Peptide chain release factor 1 [Candidatus Tremblaya phenacola]